MKPLPTLIAAALLALAGCGRLQERYRAAQGVHDFFAAVQSGDQAAFDAHVDRPALRAGLKDRLGKTLAGGDGGGILGALLGSRSADSALDQMITPESFRILWRKSGLPTDRVPSAVEISPLLILKEPGKACVRKGLKSDQCVLDFMDEDGTWKLVGVNPGRLKLGPVSVRLGDRGPGLPATAD
jgi:hypothetical protein